MKLRTNWTCVISWSVRLLVVGSVSLMGNRTFWRINGPSLSFSLHFVPRFKTHTGLNCKINMKRISFLVIDVEMAVSNQWWRHYSTMKLWVSKNKRSNFLWRWHLANRHLQYRKDFLTMLWFESKVIGQNTLAIHLVSNDDVINDGQGDCDNNSLIVNCFIDQFICQSFHSG